MGSFSVYHLLILLVIVVLIFGTKKLKNIGQDLGGAVKGFKDGVKDGSESAETKSNESAAQHTTSQATNNNDLHQAPQVPPPVVERKDNNTIDVEAKTK